MTVREAGWLRDAYDLVFLYRTSEVIRNQVNSTFLYNQRPVFFYVETLVRFSLNYFRYYRQIFQREIGYFNSRAVRRQWQDILPNRLWDFFQKCAADSREFEKVRQTISNPEPIQSVYSQAELRRFAAADSLRNPQQRVDLIDQLINHHTHTREQAPTAVGVAKKITEEEEQIEELLKRASTKPEELTKTLPAEKPKAPQEEAGEEVEENPYERLVEMGKQKAQQFGIEKIAKDLSSRGQIAVQRAEAGVEGGGENLAARMGEGALRAGGGLVRAAGGAAARGFMAFLFTTPVGWAILGVLLLFLVLPILLNLLDSSALLPPFQQQVGFAVPIGVDSRNITSCKFTRAGVSKPVKSSGLVDIFQEVSAKSGVPASALASLAMHESETFTSGALDNHDAFGNDITMSSGCKHFGLPSFGLGSSPTGALGIMQVQPTKKVHDQIWQAWEATRSPNSIYMKSFEETGAHSTDGVKRGAEMVGKNYDLLTLQDFCDVRTSVYLGAGVLIAKNTGRPPTTGEEVKNAVCGYYGQCQYGPYNYGEEAKKDFENCNPGYSPPGLIGFSITCPLQNPTISCGTQANPINRCGHGGLGYTEKCDPTYYKCNGDRYSDALYHSIDVKSSNPSVVLPYINNGESLEWTKVQNQPEPIGGGSWGYKLTYQSIYKGKQILLDLTHINQRVNPNRTSRSGEAAGSTYSGIGHLHTALSVDGRWVEPVGEATMCSR